MLLAGAGEGMARAVHAAYVAARKEGPTDPDDPSLVNWRDLHEELRASSRAQAAHLGEKLREIGCGIAPLAEWDAPEASLTDDEIETLAILEHDRFVAERRAAGWLSGPRDPEWYNRLLNRAHHAHWYHRPPYKVHPYQVLPSQLFSHLHASSLTQQNTTTSTTSYRRPCHKV